MFGNKQRVLLRFSKTDKYDASSMDIKMKQIPRIGERFALNVVDSGTVTDVCWCSDSNNNIYPTVFIKRTDDT